MSLENRLRDAMTIMEATFSEFDSDAHGEIKFDELSRKLAMRGFHDIQKLQTLFAKVDKNKTGQVGFSEFLMLMYLWNDVGPSAYDIMFGDSQRANVVNHGFTLMEQCYIRYDSDKTRVLKHDEFQRFMVEQLDSVYRSPGSVEIISKYFPAEKNHLRFNEFLYVMYRLLVPHGGTRSHAMSPTHAQGGGFGAQQAGSSTPAFQMILHAFGCMERDFARFDLHSNGCIDLAELTQGLGAARPSGELVEVLGRLEHYFQQVDLDGSGSLNFFEFMYLMYLMVQTGAYKDIIQQPNDAAAVKKCLLFLESSYIKYDVGKTRRLNITELQSFLQDNFSMIDPNVIPIFERLRTSPEKPTIDLCRFMRLLYEVVCPTGRYVLSGSKPSAAAAQAKMLQTYIGPPPVIASNRIRYETLEPREVTKEKQIGQGGFGAVYLGKYRGQPVAAKYLLESASPQLCAETEKEVNVMRLFDHPNIVFLIAACTRMPEVCIVTEFCKNGSLFDCMHKKRIQFDAASMWRIARECAVGLSVLHHAQPQPVIHRDIKSLNILLDENFTVKICDFGLSKVLTRGSMMMTKGLGTPHWMAPEVITSSHYGTPSDVYSYGILLWELFHRQIPYGSLDASQIAMGVATKQLRPTMSQRVNRTMARVMTWCWHQDPAQRPTFDAVIQFLDSVQGEFSSS